MGKKLSHTKIDMDRKNTIEETDRFQPKFDSIGLIPCVTKCADTGDVLMVAYMNETAIHKTLETGQAHYWSRSRQELWHKGATSGHTQELVILEIDCDQDCLLMHVKLKEPVSCHTGRKSCFYRLVKNADGKISLEFKD